jgi:hypothetical protein
MYRKISWLLAQGLFVAAVVVVVCSAMGVGRPAGAAPDLQELTERQRRLEVQLAALDRSLGRRGAELGARMASAAGTTAQPAAEASGPEEGTREYEAAQPRLEEVAWERERRRFDHLDSLARAGGGEGARSQLQKNVATLLALPKEKGGGKIDAVDCGQTVCRVEMRVRRVAGKSGLNVAADYLAEDMGEAMSVRTLPDGRSVIYLATPGHQLPPLSD